MDDKGKENSHELTNLNVAALPGHTVSVIWAAKAGQDRGYNLKMINHTTGQFFVNDGMSKTLVESDRSYALTYLLMWVYIIALITLIICFCTSFSNMDRLENAGLYTVLSGIALVLLIARPIRGSMRLKSDIKKLKDGLDNINIQTS